MVIGYINRLNDISEEELINHLMESKKSFCRSKCVSNIQRFKKRCYFTFWGKVLDKINSAANSGILVRILGTKELQAS